MRRAYINSGLNVGVALALLGAGAATPVRTARGARRQAARGFLPPRKPPMNGKREVARRLRQIERGDVLNHPTVAQRQLTIAGVPV